MSCNTSSTKAAGAAVRNGVAAGASKKVFLVGATAAVLGGWLLARSLSRRSKPAPSSPLKPLGPARVKPLAGPTRVEPVSAGQARGQQCAECQAPARGQGAWYDFGGGRLYCQTCAQEQAGQEGVSLVRPAATARPEKAFNYSQTGRRTTLKPRMVKVGPLENVEGYAVWTGKRDTGLTLVPEVKIAGGGQAQINKNRWFVNYDRAGKPVAGPYASVSEARGMASLLANFDWTKGVEKFADDEIRRTARLAKEYREELDFRDHMRQISQ